MAVHLVPIVDELAFPVSGNAHAINIAVAAAADYPTASATLAGDHNLHRYACARVGPIATAHTIHLYTLIIVLERRHTVISVTVDTAHLAARRGTTCPIPRRACEVLRMPFTIVARVTVASATHCDPPDNDIELRIARIVASEDAASSAVNLPARVSNARDVDHFFDALAVR